MMLVILWTGLVIFVSYWAIGALQVGSGHLSRYALGKVSSTQAPAGRKIVSGKGEFNRY